MLPPSPSNSDKASIDSSVLARASGALKGAVQGWFGAGLAPAPVTDATQQEQLAGRQFDFPAQANTRWQPRAGEATTFAQLRGLADSCDILRLVIETRKDQLAKMRFSIRPLKPKQPVDDRCAQIEAFLKTPDGEHTWSGWLRMLLEDMFVTDAATIYPWLNNNGTPYRFEILDGSTIKRVIDDRGRTPAAPLPAYQQILKGMAAVNYTADELVYNPRNKRSNKLYGFSPVEQIVNTVNIAIRRSLYQLQYYTEGSTPDLIFQAPKDWNMTQVKDFNDWWDSKLRGNTAERRRTQFVPNGIEPINTKEGALVDKYDEWLARIVCYAFSVSPQSFVSQVNRATAETAHKQALEEGLHPIMQWVKDTMDLLIWKYFDCKDLEFVWEDQESVSPDLQSQIDDRALKNGTVTVNEIRAKRGDDPVEGGDVPLVLTSSGYVPINAYTLDAERKTLELANAPSAVPAALNAAKAPTTETTNATKVSKGLFTGLMPIDRERPAITKARGALEDTLKKSFKKMADRVAKETLKVKKDKSDPFGGLDWEEWTEALAVGFTTTLVAVAKDGSIEASVQIGIETNNAVNDAAVAWAEQHAAELVGKKVVDGALVDNPDAAYGIVDTTRDLIRADVAAAKESGATTDELAATLRDSYAFSDARAETIARTEVARTDVQSSLITYRESGVVEGKRWLVGAGCCQDCADIDGEEVGLDEDFSNGESGAPAHPNCRCDVIPVLTPANEQEGTDQ